MVHVPVGDAQVVARQRKLRRAPDVEADIQLRHLHHRLLPRHAVADDGVRPERQLRVPLGKELAGRYVW